MPHWLTKARTAIALGLPNIARAAYYRAGVRLGLNPVRRLRGVSPEGPFFRPSRAEALKVDAVPGWKETALLFSRWPITLSDAPPDWLSNPMTGQPMPAPDRPWWQIPDFDPAVGDIKLIWELSRMDWVLALAQRAREGESGALEKLNGWLADWCEHNPPYRGPNWKCGQEASFRVMHLACAALLLDQVKEALPALRDLIVLHLQRIAPTVQYAMAQDNNHGTSEAAALFMGGSWLGLLGDRRGSNWAAMGRSLLENRGERLIGEQGTFSQYSLNYHRVMLDTFSMAERWRRAMGLPLFSSLWQTRAKAATFWLYAMIDPESGDGPNVGANDGARLLQLTATSYRDFRPCLQMAMVLFAGQRAYAGAGPWDDGLLWLGVALPEESAAAQACLQADDGGFMVLRRGETMVLLRYPRFNFRPSQADLLHVDLWVAGQNLLRDGGSYSYNAESRWLNYFGGTAGHNTVQFDEREQMPRLGRFLLGDWLQTKDFEPLQFLPNGVRAGAGYRDAAGAEHHRRVELEDRLLRVTDRVQGFCSKAVLRWRLAPSDWKTQSEAGNDYLMRLFDGRGHQLLITSNVTIVRCEIVPGWESLHYLEKTSVPVLEVEVAQPGLLTTEYHWEA